MSKKIFGLLLLVLLTLNSYSQRRGYSSGTIINTGIGGGFFKYYGDITNEPGLKSIKVPKYSIGGHLSISYYLNNFLDIEASFGYGSINDEDNRKNYRSNNFKTSLLQVSASALISINRLINPSARQFFVDPYVIVGFGFISYNPKTDIRDAEGLYHVWPEDGNVYDVPYVDSLNTESYKSSHLKTRDNEFETELESEKFGLVMPIGIGLKFNISPLFSLNINSILCYTFIDDIDGFVKGSNDMYYYFSFGAKYCIAGGKKASKNYRSRRKY